MPIVTIKDVARAANVSIATVSRVFNNAEVVEEATRVRVEEVSQSLNYVPNALGRSLSTSRTDAIGLLLPDLFGEFFSEVLRGSDQTAQQSNYHLVVSSSHNDRAEIRAALRMMRGRVDGLVIMSPHLDAETLNRNLPQSLPVVLLNCYVDTDRFDSLNIDNYGGAYAMTQHLLSHGHQHIAIIKGTEKNIDAAERLRGFNMAVADHGGDGGARYEISGNFSEATGYDAVKEILALTPRPTAVFASNDSMAIGALSALRDSGLQVPKDIALAGFDDVPIASYMTPSLTTVRVGIHSLGVHAIQTVLHAFKNKNEHHKQQVLLPTTLSLRGSCGCDQFNNVN
jgi:LacI family transcriptional regulator